MVSRSGLPWSGEVVCFKTNPLACTLLACWEANYQDPWLIVTDLASERANVEWYGLRASTECVYRDLKSDGWKWHRTRLQNPKRAERMWLVLAVATLWMVIQGAAHQSSSSSYLTSTPVTSDNRNALLGEFSSRKGSSETSAILFFVGLASCYS